MEDARRELSYRPLLLMAVALCVGLTVARHPLNGLFLLPLLWARRPWPVALALGLGLTLAPRPVEMLTQGRWIDGAARILSVPVESPQRVSAEVEVAGTRYRAYLPPETLASRGEVWRIRGKAEPLSEAMEGLREKGIVGVLKPVALSKRADGPLLWRAADGWRRGFASFARANLPMDQARWLNAFAFRINDFDEEEIASLKATGTIHLIAASGLHVAALGMLLMGLVSILGLPRATGLVAVFGALVAFTMATGLHLPTVRAALAFAAGSAAYLARREADGLSSIALAALVYLPFDPPAVYSLGFQLSVTVVGMLVLWPRRRSEEPVRTVREWMIHHARDLVAVSLIAALAAEPILAWHTGDIGLLTVPTNVVAVPPTMGAVLLTFVLHPLHAGWAMPAVGGLVEVARATILAMPEIPITVPPFSPYLLVLWFVPWIAFWRPRARPCR